MLLLMMIGYWREENIFWVGNGNCGGRLHRRLPNATKLDNNCRGTDREKYFSIVDKK
jgi:hypothetical protein